MPLSPAFNPKGYKARLLNPHVVEFYYETPRNTQYIQFDFFTRLVTVGDDSGAKAVKSFNEVQGDVLNDIRNSMRVLEGLKPEVSYDDRLRTLKAAANEATQPKAPVRELPSPGPRYEALKDSLMEKPERRFEP